MAGELSKILEHVETMNELDLEGVEPTSHVVDLTNVLREDVPRPSLPREVALEQAPDATESGFRVPSPERRERRAARPDRRAAGASGSRPARSPPPSCSSYWRERAAADDLGAYLWVADEAPDDAGTLPPIAVKDLFCVEGRAEHGGLAHPRGLPPALHGDERRATCSRPARGCSARRTRTSSPWARRTRTPASARCRTRGTARACPGGSSRRQRRGRGGRHGAVGDRHRHRRLDPPAGERCAGSSGMKPTYGAVSRYGMIAFASSLDQCGPLTRDVTDAAILLSHLRAATRATPPRSASRGRIALPTAERLDGLRFGVWGMEEAGLEPGVAEQVRATLAKIEELGGSVEQIELPHAGHGIAAYYVIAPAEASANLARYDGVRYGPRAADDGDLTAHVRADPPRRLRRGGQAPHHDRHLRALVGLLRGLLRHRAEGAHEDRRGLRGGLRAGGLRGHARPRRRWRSSSASAPRTRSRCTCRTTTRCRCRSPGIPAISIPCGLSEGLPVGFQIAGPAFSESRILDAAHALEQAIGFEGVPVRVTALRAGHRHRDPRPAEHADEDVLRLRALVRRRAEHAHLPDLPRPPGHAAGDERGGGALRADDRDGLRAARSRRARSSTARTTSIPTCPKGYQISQYDIPLATGGPSRRRAHPPRAHGGGRREARPRGQLGPHPRRRDERRGLQPRRHAARRDRDRARPPLGRGGRGVRPPAPGHAPAHGRLRREHGGGLAADGRERVDPARRRRPRSARRPSSRT